MRMVMVVVKVAVMGVMVMVELVVMIGWLDGVVILILVIMMFKCSLAHL